MGISILRKQYNFQLGIGDSSLKLHQFGFIINGTVNNYNFTLGSLFGGPVRIAIQIKKQTTPVLYFI